MLYRLAVNKDLEAINGILNVSFEKIYAHYARKSFAGLLNAIVAEENGKITGAINYRIFVAGGNSIGYLYYMAVHPDHRRRGVGKGLIHQAVHAIEKEAGLTGIYAAIEKKNKPSQVLADQCGFKPVKRSALKDQFGKERTKLFLQMNFMPWEELYFLPEQRK